jgi:cytochrome P450
MLDYDPFVKEIWENPHPIYKRLRDEAPAYFIQKYDAWALSRFQDIWDCSSDPRFSTAGGTTPAQVLTKEQPVTPMLNVMDPPDHTKLRAAIRKCFLPRHLKGLEPVARKLFNDLVDEVIDRGECDLVQDLAARFSVQIACLAIGLPGEDGPFLNGVVKRFFHHDPGQQGMTSDGLAALQELTDYCVDKVRERRRSPQDGPEALNALVTFDALGSRFSDEEAASHTTMLIIGGSETFPKTLANGVLRLWEHKDQRPEAYDEILRYDMPTQFLCRTLKGDIELHGQTLREGHGVLFLYACANRDDREFENPDVFDVRRAPKRILSFGAGTHACLGTHPARLEGKITLETILARMPDYEVDLEHAERLHTEFVQGFSSLPIHFRPA